MTLLICVFELLSNTFSSAHQKKNYESCDHLDIVFFPFCRSNWQNYSATEHSQWESEKIVERRNTLNAEIISGVRTHCLSFCFHFHLLVKVFSYHPLTNVNIISNRRLKIKRKKYHERSASHTHSPCTVHNTVWISFAIAFFSLLFFFRNVNAKLNGRIRFGARERRRRTKNLHKDILIIKRRTESKQRKWENGKMIRNENWWESERDEKMCAQKWQS